MKKIILSFAVVSIIVFFALSNLSFGASKAIKVVVGGETLTMDSAPVVENGRTLAPMRAIFESLDVYIDWDSKTKTITAYKGKKVVKIKIGS
ncbi:MAG: copper amine oxidase N-terminal domain-containing protein, partial [Bacillota bacterium]|nr:copper amine oxidase N-terminal domain-containing protein [Bacillota bacterium]